MFIALLLQYARCRKAKQTASRRSNRIVQINDSAKKAEEKSRKAKAATPLIQTRSKYTREIRFLRNGKPLC